MKKYVDKDKLQEFTEKLTNKYKTMFSSPLVASTVAEMTDTTKVYVYVGSESGYTFGNWYYYNGSAWTSGGVYNAVAVETDTTLAVSGMAADAKAVGDALTNIDIEVDDTLTQAGEAADAKATGDKITDLKNVSCGSKAAIIDLADNMSDSIVQTVTLSAIRHYWDIETGIAVYTTMTSGTYMAADPISVTEGEIYTVSGNVGTTHKARIWVLTDDDMKVIATAQDYYVDAVKTETFIVPSGATKLLITTKSQNTPSPYATLYKKVLYEVAKADEVENISNNIFQPIRQTNFTLSGQGYFWNIETNVAVYTPLAYTNWKASSVIPVQEGEIYTVSGDQGQTHKARIWVLTDDNMNIIAMAEDHYTTTEEIATETFVVPSGATKLVLTTRYDAGSPYVWLYKKQSALDILSEKLLDGKTVAILGDSISTNGNTGTDANVPEITITADDVGVELSAYLTYYDVQEGLSLGDHVFTSAEIGTEVTFTPTLDDVGKSIGLPNNYNPNTTTTWWEVAKEKLGFTAIPVCWSGSSVTSHEANTDTRKTAHAWHDAQIRKCGIRIPGSMTRVAPDMIIIYRGTNDFSHSPYTLLTDDYFADYNWQYPLDDSVTGGYGFKEGLCLTVKKLREAYPNAQIWICTLNVFKRINYSHFPTNNGIDSLPQYNNAIREVADFLGCNVIEFDKDGITFENCYSGGYITDSATIPTHPTDKGHAVMGRKAIADIKSQYNEL